MNRPEHQRDSLVCRGIRVGACLSALFTSSATLAQTDGSITFTPDTAATSVPTLGGTLLLLLALLLGVIALRQIRHSGNLASFATSALIAGALASAVAGGLLVQESRAGVSTTITDSQGETFPVNCFLNVYENQSGVNMTVTAFELPTGCISPTNTAEPACALNTRLADGESCSTNFGGLDD
jgi:hypothetical protein